MRVDYREIITLETGKKSGRACIRGLRFLVSDVLGYLASGMSPNEIIEELHELTLVDIKTSLVYATEFNMNIEK